MSSLRINNHNKNEQPMKAVVPKNRFQELLTYWKNFEEPKPTKTLDNIRITTKETLKPVKEIDENTDYLQGLVGKALQQYNPLNPCLKEGLLLIKGYAFLSSSEKKIIMDAINDDNEHPQAAAWLKNRLENGYGFYGITDNDEGSSTGTKRSQLQGLAHYNSELGKFKPLINQNDDMDLEAFNKKFNELIDQKSKQAARTMAKLITSYDLTVFQHLREAHQVFPSSKTEGGKRVSGDQTHLCDFAKLSILSAPNATVAKERIEFWIRVMKKLETIKPQTNHISVNRKGNLQSFTAIMGALYSAPVERLKAVWDKVDPSLVQYKETHADFQHDLRDNISKYMDSCMIPIYSSFNSRVDINGTQEIQNKIEVSMQISGDYKKISHLSRNYWLPTYNKTFEIPALPKDEKDDYFWELSDKIKAMSRIQMSNGLFGIIRKAIGL